jgi:uncharacterized membrane protein
MISALISWIPIHVAIQNLGFKLGIVDKFYSYLLLFVIVIAVIGAVFFVLQFFIKEKNFKRRPIKFS